VALPERGALYGRHDRRRAPPESPQCRARRGVPTPKRPRRTRLLRGRCGPFGGAQARGRHQAVPETKKAPPPCPNHQSVEVL
ncbi:MAG: UPF0213 protein YhbQ, partial [uncultured Truepera sp.]